MRRVLSLLIATTLYSTIANAQVPQGINYQAVAYNNLGQPVTNQTVGVRLSILDGGAAGPVLYSETQAPNTDNTGLFSIVIGNGTVVSGTFAGINWGNGTRWLKTEIDIAGGNNYVVMGSSQFMSVPYALYAEKTGFSSGSFTIPDGFNNVTTVVIQDSTDYTVPTGKNLYLPSANYLTVVDGDSLRCNVYSGGANAKTFIGASENSIVWSPFSTTGFLTDKKVEWKTIDFGATPFTVPANKQFVVINSGESYKYGYTMEEFLSCRTTINGIDFPINGNIILSSGSVVSATGCTSLNAEFILNGYFMDK